jgi:hypothetical protein
MNIVTIKHTVADYDKWKIGYDADEPNRRAAGATAVTHPGGGQRRRVHRHRRLHPVPRCGRGRWFP